MGVLLSGPSEFIACNQLGQSLAGVSSVKVVNVVEFVAVVEGFVVVVSVVVEVKAETSSGSRLVDVLLVGVLTVEVGVEVVLATVEATGSTGCALLFCCSTTCRDRRVFKGTSLSLSLVEEATVLLVDVVVTEVVDEEGEDENDMI